MLHTLQTPIRDIVICITTESSDSCFMFYDLPSSLLLYTPAISLSKPTTCVNKLKPNMLLLAEQIENI